MDIFTESPTLSPRSLAWLRSTSSVFPRRSPIFPLSSVTSMALAKAAGSIPPTRVDSPATFAIVYRNRATAPTPGTAATWSAMVGEKGTPTAFETT